MKLNKKDHPYGIGWVIQMANQKLSKFGIFLASVAVMGATQILPETVPFMGTQVVRAEESDEAMILTVTPYNIETKKKMITSYDDVVVYEVNQGESVVLSAPVIEGFVYENYQIFSLENDYLEKGIDNTLTISPSRFPDNKSVYNLYWGYRPSNTTPKHPNQDPATNDNANTGNGSNEGGSVSNPTDTPNVPDNGTNTSENLDTGQNGDVSDNTNTPTTSDDNNTSGGDQTSHSGGEIGASNQGQSNNNGENTNDTNTEPTDTTSTSDTDATETSATGEVDKETDTPSQPVDTDLNLDTGTPDTPSTPTPSTPDTSKDTDDKPMVTPETPNTSESGKTTDTEQPVDTTDKVTDSTSQLPPVLVDDKFDLGTIQVDVEEKTAKAEEMPVTPATSDKPATKSQPLSRVESRHLPQTGDSHSILASLFGLTGLSIGLFDRCRYKK